MNADLAYFEQDRLWGQRPEPYQTQVVADILSLIPEDVETVLDVGCGDGLVTNALPERLDVLGVDTSEEALRHVRRRCRHASITALPLEDRRFDLVLCNDVLEHLEEADFARALSELARVASRYVLLTVPNDEQLAGNFARCAECGGEYHVNHHRRSFDHQRLLSCLGEPFRPIEIRYSGDVTRPPQDATLALRHSQGHYRSWQQAICPHCGSAAQASGREDGMLWAMESLRACDWAERLARSGPHDCRTEILTLFAREAADARRVGQACGAGRVERAPPTCTFPGSLLAIDFTNPLQAAVPDITPGASWARYLLSDQLQRDPKGVRRAPAAAAATLCTWFPADVQPGDRLVVEFSGVGSISLVAVDGVARTREVLGVLPGEGLPERVAIELADPWAPGRFGLGIEVLLSGEVVMHSLDYRRADERPHCHPMVRLQAGHNVVPLGTEAGAAVTWGFQAAEAGRVPLPRRIEAEPDRPSRTLDDLLAYLGRASEQFGRRQQRRLIAESQVRQNLQDEICDLRRHLRARSGIRGGAKEILRSVKRRLWPEIEASPAGPFPSPWQPLDPSQPGAVKPGDRRVLVLSHMFPHPAQPGSGSFVLEQVKALRSRAGIDARVLSGVPFWMNVTRRPWQFWAQNRAYWQQVAQAAWCELEGVPVLYVPYRAMLGFWNHGRMYRSAMARVVESVRAGFAFDLVHAHTSYLDGSAGRWIARRYGVPLAITEHTGPFSQLTRWPIVRGETVASLAAADRVIAVSTAQQRDMRPFMPPERRDRLIVLPNGVDTDLFHPPSARQADPRAPRFLFAGYFCEVKNLPLLVTAFAKVRERIPAARLKLLGRGETPQDEAEVRRLVDQLALGDAVELLGFQPRESVARIMREESDLLVLSSRSESFGCVAIEAMSCGLPVVSTRCGGPEDVVTEPWLGRLCENRNPEALAEAMIDAASRLDAFDAEQIRRHAEENFSYASLARRLAAVYQSLERKPQTLCRAA